MMLVLSDSNGNEVGAWISDRIDFAASIQRPGRVQICFDIFTPDPKGLAKAIARQRRDMKGDAA